MQCGARTRSGAPCKTLAMPNGRCRMHRGNAVSGIAHPQFKTGRHSKHLPVRLAAQYQEALADGDLLALRDELALLDTRLNELLERVDSADSEQRWKRARKALADYLGADGAQQQVALQTLEDTMESGAADYAIWTAIQDVIEQRRRVADSERKRLEAMQQMMTTEQAMTLLAAVTDTIRRHVVDRPILAAISADFGRLVAGSARGVAGSRTH
jgi:hypothetical protein